MSAHSWTLYTAAVVLLCLTPGPNSLLAVANGARYGVARTMLSSAGCSVGLALLIALSLSGLGVVLAASESVFYLIKYLGAAYLVYLGFGLVRSRGALDTLPAKHARTTPPSPLRLFGQGLGVIVLNPKVLIFFTAFLPQFYDVSAGFWPQFLAMAATFVVIELIIELLLASGASRITRAARRGGMLRWFNRVTGGVFMLAGGWLLTMERPA